MYPVWVLCEFSRKGRIGRMELSKFCLRVSREPEPAVQER